MAIRISFVNIGSAWFGCSVPSAWKDGGGGDTSLEERPGAPCRGKPKWPSKNYSGQVVTDWVVNEPTQVSASPK